MSFVCNVIFVAENGICRLHTSFVDSANWVVFQPNIIIDARLGKMAYKCCTIVHVGIVYILQGVCGKFQLNSSHLLQ